MSATIPQPRDRSLRAFEHAIDHIIRKAPPATGRRWREVEDVRGRRSPCWECGRRARLFIGSYYTGSSVSSVRWEIHSSQPLCAGCASTVQTRESRLPHWRER